MAESSENIKFSDIAENEINTNENFPKPILTVTPEYSTTINTIGAQNYETSNQVDFDGVGDYLTIEDQPIEDKLYYDAREVVYFTNNGTPQNVTNPGTVQNASSNWTGYAIGAPRQLSGVEWNTRVNSGESTHYSFVGFRTADDTRSLVTTDGYKNITYEVYNNSPAGKLYFRRQGPNGGNNNSRGEESVSGNFHPSEKIKMIVNPFTQRVEIYYADSLIYTFDEPLTQASYPLRVMACVYRGIVENIKTIPETQFNNYISDKCWTFNCWIRIPATQLTTGSKYFLAINDGSIAGGNVYLVGINYTGIVTQLYTHNGSVGRIGTNISSDEWHMLTISQQPQEPTIYNPPYEYHSSNSVYGNDTIGTDHGRGQLDGPQAWSLPHSDQNNGYVINSRWYQIQLPKQKVFGTVTQGRYNSLTQQITKWKFKYSLDNIIWTDVDNGAEFVGNTDSNTKVHQTFANPVFARYIRFYPQVYSSHASARMALVVEPLPGHISVYLDGQKDTGASQGAGDNYISIPSSAKWSIGMKLNLTSSGDMVQGQYFKGSAKEIMMWDKGLSDYEIAALHKLGNNWCGQTNIIEEDAVFTSSRGHNTVIGNNVQTEGNTANNWLGGATTDRDSSIVGMTFQLIDSTANVMVGLLGDGTHQNGDENNYWWKGWKVYVLDGVLQARYAPDGGSETEDLYRTPSNTNETQFQTVTTQTVKLIINEDTNYPEIYIDDKWVHTYNPPKGRTINISDYPFACAVSCKVGGVKNVKVLKKVLSPRYSHSDQPFNPVFDPPYTHHSSPWIINGEDPGENREEGRGRLSGNGAWIPVYDTTVGNGNPWATTTHVNSNNETYYYQIDYGVDGNDKTLIAGVVTYGRYNNPQRVTKWKFKYFNGSTWEWVDNGNEFDGNTHNEQRNMVYFAAPVNTTGIRFFPTGYSSYPAARMALLLYKPNAPLYAIVDGHGGVSKEGQGFFNDITISAQIGYFGTEYGSQPTCMRITTDSHSLDFSMHPGYPNGAARIEYANNGSSLLGNQSIGWTPAGSQYHTYFVTMRSNGTHTFGIIDADYVRTWSKDFSLSNWSSFNIEVALSCEGSFVTASIPVGGSAEFTRNGQHKLKSLLVNFNRDNKNWVFNGNNYLRLEGLLADSTKNNRTFVGKTNISFSCWFYKINQDTDDDVIYSCHDGTTNRYTYYVNKDGSLRFGIGGGEQWITRTGFIQTQKWYHYAFTRNGGTFTFYINGKKVNDDDIVTHEDSTTKNPLINQVSHSYTTNYRFSIGQEWDGGTPSDHWRGKISNIYFWDRTITDDEIYSVYHNFGISKSEFAGKPLMDNTNIPEASNNANISISSYFKDKQFHELEDYPFTFTNCGATGMEGPILTQCVSEYSDSLIRINMTTQGIQEWTVPKTGTYKIEAYGASGGHGGVSTKAGGLGAQIVGIFHLERNEIIKILVGQKGQEYGNGLSTTSAAGGAGGGGTFVLKSPYNSASSVLIIAGGGGGSSHQGNTTVNAAQDINARLPNDTDTGGGGGNASYGVGGGGGLITNGSGNSYGTGSFGKSFVNGGQGGIGGYSNDNTSYRNYGGFGGGGGNGAHAGGGGGGINGGTGGHYNDSKGGTGGASYNTGLNQTIGYNMDPHGKVTIKLISFLSHTFTNCGATGHNGPTLTQCVSEYSDSLVNMTTQGIQEWTVPNSGSYKIKAWGADAVNRTGGKGGIIEATFTLIKGEVIKILCGQRPEPYNSNNGSGAGGTFVVRSPYTNIGSVLIAAGGGGGGHTYSLVTGEKHGGFYGNGNGGTGTTGFTGGTNGNAGTNAAGASGAGFLTDGGATGGQLASPKSFVNGGVGGSAANSTYKGGFGGGGAHGNSHGGGGGGYSGGAGSSQYPYQGGGGGSIANGSDVTTWTGASNGWVGEGKVEITFL